MASIQQRERADGTVSWRVMYRIDGRQVSDSFGDPEAAEKYRKQVERLGGKVARDSLLAHSLSAFGTPTLAEFFEHHLAHLTGAEEGTVAEYRRLAKRTWLPVLGHLPVDVLARDQVKKWVGTQAATITRKGTPTAPKTIANAHGLLSSTLAEAVAAGLIPGNPARGVTLPTGEQEEMVFLSHNEFARLLAAVATYWQTFVLTIVGTGMRWGEATALRWGDVDLDADVPVVRIARAWKKGVTVRKLGAPKSKRSRRTISLPHEVVDALRELGPGAPGEFVFVGPRGGRVHHQAFHPRFWLPAVERSNIGKTPRIHDLRHTHASWLLAAGVPPHVVQRRLGHESIKTTVDTYGHLMDDAQTTAARAASLALTGAAPILLAIEANED